MARDRKVSLTVSPWAYLTSRLLTCSHPTLEIDNTHTLIPQKCIILLWGVPDENITKLILLDINYSPSKKDTSSACLQVGIPYISFSSSFIRQIHLRHIAVCDGFCSIINDSLIRKNRVTRFHCDTSFRQQNVTFQCKMTSIIRPHTKILPYLR